MERSAAHPHPRPFGTTIGDGASKVQHVQAPASAGDDVLHADELPGPGIPVQVLIERPAQYAVRHDTRALDLSFASKAVGS